jgi:hypothetical protein
MAEDFINGVLDRETSLQELARVLSQGGSKIRVLCESQRNLGETFVVSIQHAQARTILFEYFEEVISGIDAREGGLAPVHVPE